MISPKFAKRFIIERYTTHAGRWYLYWDGAIVGKVVRQTEGGCAVTIYKKVYGLSESDLTALVSCIRELNQM
jgi:hypothetical protein